MPLQKPESEQVTAVGDQESNIDVWSFAFGEELGWMMRTTTVEDEKRRALAANSLSTLFYRREENFIYPFRENGRGHKHFGMRNHEHFSRIIPEKL
jgi:hypothetical protein